MKEGTNPDVDEIRKLVSGRLKKAVADGPHPDPNLLAAFAENALPDAARKQLLQHLGGCSDCREILYLAMPDSAVAQKVPSFQPRRFSVFAWRWGTVAASIAIATALFVTTRHKTTALYPDQKAVVPSAPAPAQIARNDGPLDRDRVQSVQNERPVNRVPAKTVPEPKHMTARPKTELAFDSSGQVHMRPQAGGNTVQDEGAAAKLEHNHPVESAKNATEHAKDRSLDDRKLIDAVAVSAGAAQVSGEKQTAADLNLKKAVAMPRTAQGYSGPQAAAAALSAVLPQWKLSADGALQRSFNSGRTWQNVAIANQPSFRFVSALGPEVWAGGNAGVLYHSADSGQNWTRIEPAVSGQKLTADITHIEFSDALNGSVTAANGEVWTTADGGQSWQRK